MTADPQRQHPGWDAMYQGTLDPLPRALFCVMRREG